MFSPDSSIRDFILIGVCATGILTGIIVPPLWLFLRNPPPRVQYRIIVFILFFVLAAIMALLFGIHGELDSQVGMMTLKIGGPFAAFLGALVIVLRLFDYQEETALEAHGDYLDRAIELIGQTEKRCEWIPYESWKRHLDGYEEINGQEEEHFLRNILIAAYSPSETAKVNDVSIATAFLYLTDSVIKLQRVHGIAAENPTMIRFKSHSSYGNQDLRSLILIAEPAADGRLTLIKTISDEDPPDRVPLGYARIDHRKFDCLILTQYAEYPRHEDYLLVDVTRFSRENQADMSLAIVSTKLPLKIPDVWQMRRATVSTRVSLPLAFRKFRTPPNVGWSRVLTEFEPWLSLIDSNAIRKTNVSNTLGEVRQNLLNCLEAKNGEQALKLGELLRLLGKSNAYTFQAEKGSDTLLALFTWQAVSS